jgi:hypothetical protein
VGVPRLPDQLVSRDVRVESLIFNENHANDHITVHGASVTPHHRAELGLSFVHALFVALKKRPVDNFLGPNIEIRRCPDTGWAAFALNALHAGSIVATFGGTSAHLRSLAQFAPDRIRRSIQIDDDLFLVGPKSAEPGDFVNHSCEPNCGMRNATQVVTMREVEPGEELTFDYAMTDTAPYDEFDCQCGSPRCRGQIRADDWRLSSLRTTYGRWLSPHVRRLIEARETAKRLSKADAEVLLATFDADPVAALTRALRIVRGTSHASWETLVSGLPHAQRLLALDISSLDRLAAELNETRTICLNEGIPQPGQHTNTR